MEVDGIARANPVGPQPLGRSFRVAEYLGPAEGVRFGLEVVVHEESAVRMQPRALAEEAGNRAVSNHTVDHAVHQSRGSTRFRKVPMPSPQSSTVAPGSRYRSNSKPQPPPIVPLPSRSPGL